ncbi:MAG TPA: hypothetical protein VMJ12_06150 [Candidatus Acidoferrales bacterium]|nr:hypothetical protein [Candidatus Acidoferrales bacterium]
MNILLAFAPFLIFALVDRFVSPVAGLASGAVVALALVVRDAMSRSKKVKVLEAGTVILFGALAAWALFGKMPSSIIWARLCVDAGLLLIVLVSMAIRQPFTLQYARETTPETVWATPEFIRVNYVITAVWAAAFAVMVAADLVMFYMPDVPMKIGIWITIIAIYAAVKFTSWYPDRKR